MISSDMFSSILAGKGTRAGKYGDDMLFKILEIRKSIRNFSTKIDLVARLDNGAK